MVVVVVVVVVVVALATVVVTVVVDIIINSGMSSSSSCSNNGNNLRLGEITSSICIFCLSLAGHKIVYTDPSLRYNMHVAGMLSNQETRNNLL